MIINNTNGGVNLGKKKFLSLAFMMLLLLSTALFGCSINEN
jgi:peptide/nickel transport system substrate-binding protein